MAVHSEDEDRLNARKASARERGDPRTHPVWRDVETARASTERVLRLAREAGRRLHVLHVTTATRLPLLAAASDFATAETTPQHLTLAAPECYERLGTYAQMNPPIRDASHREALWEAVREGVIDVIGSDHAPHTREEKDKTYPDTPSGMPGVQTLVTILLDHVNAGRLTPGALRRSHQRRRRAHFRHRRQGPHRARLRRRFHHRRSEDEAHASRIPGSPRAAAGRRSTA